MRDLADFAASRRCHLCAMGLPSEVLTQLDAGLLDGIAPIVALQWLRAELELDVPRLAVSTHAKHLRRSKPAVMQWNAEEAR